MRTDILGWVRAQWDRVAAWTCTLAGLISLLIGWIGVSGTAFTSKQLPYIAGNGLGGLALVATGAMLWLSADLRDEWRQLNSLEAAVREQGLAAALDAAPAEVERLARSTTHRAPVSAVGRSS